MIIVMLGAPGSGKGSIAKLLTEVQGIKHISTGDLFRDTIKTGSDIGQELEKYMSKGMLVPDDIVIEVLEKELASPSAQNGVVLDGFPRTKTQAKYLKDMLEKQNKKVDYVIQINIPDEDLIYRTVKRRICSNQDCGAIYNIEFKKSKKEGICDVCGSNLIQREDDNEETVKKRIETYHKRTEDLIKYYEEQGVLYKVNLKIEDMLTTDDAKRILENLKNNIREMEK